MRSKLGILSIAIFLGLLATLGVAFYINSLKAKVEEGAQKAPAIVALKFIPAGVSTEEMKTRGMVEERQIPRSYRAQDALSSLSEVKGRVLVTPVGAGEQLTKAKFRATGGADLAFRVPKGKLALSIPVDEVTGLSGQIKAGDRVALLATFEPGPGGRDISKILLRNIEVLSTSEEKKSKMSQGGAQTKKTITVAVSPKEAEKLVFAEEKGKVWASLLPAGGEEIPGTEGETMESIFGGKE